MSRLIYGARVSLAVCLSVVAIAMLVSLVIGLISGYVGGRTDSVLMRITDGGLSFPPLVLAIAMAGILGPGVGNVILSLSIVFIFGLTRLVRGTTLVIREEPFVEASRSSGSRTRRILSHRILPNVRSPLLIAATFGIAAALIAEAGLAYLGLGPRPPTASWGSMLRQAFDRALYAAPWQLLVPGIAIAITILAFNVLGEGLRDVLGVGRSKKRSALRTERRGLTTVVARPASASPPRRSRRPPDGGRAPAASSTSRWSSSRTRGAARWSTTCRSRSAPGETVGLVGESGSGKTVTSLSVMRLVPSPPGRIVERVDLVRGPATCSTLSFKEMRDAPRRRDQHGLPGPDDEPRPRVHDREAQLVEAQAIHTKVTQAQARARAVELLELVGIPAPEARLRQYPHQLSGGLRQRVMIAIALANEPRLLIADEPTTALDVTIQAQILDLLRSLQRELGMAVLFVTHDLGVIADLCDRVAVMYAGQIVEEAPVHDLFEHPQHPYTEGLLGAMPQVGRLDERLSVIRGQVPLPHQLPPGCRFAERCDYAIDACRAAPVPLTSSASSAVRCVRAGTLSLRGAE